MPQTRLHEHAGNLSLHSPPWKFRVEVPRFRNVAAVDSEPIQEKSPLWLACSGSPKTRRSGTAFAKLTFAGWAVP
jgi:hypothetical protein